MPELGQHNTNTDKMNKARETASKLVKPSHNITIPWLTRGDSLKVVAGCCQKLQDNQGNMCYHVNCHRRTRAHNAAHMVIAQSMTYVKDQVQ